MQLSLQEGIKTQDHSQPIKCNYSIVNLVFEPHAALINLPLDECIVEIATF